MNSLQQFLLKKKIQWDSKKTTKIFCILTILGTLTCCSSMNEASGSRTPGTYIDDFVLDIAVVERTIRKSDKRFKGSHIVVEVFDGDILLVGQVPSENQNAKATIETRKLKQAKYNKVYNYLQVAPPTTFLARTNDAYITTKIKAKLIASELTTKDDTSDRKIKVLTEDGTVYLMGVINESNSDSITSLVKSVYGVRQIVNLFKELN